MAHDRHGAIIFIQDTEPPTDEALGSLWYKETSSEYKHLIGSPKAWKPHGYAVGDIYLTTNTQNPNVILGYGIWEEFIPPLAPPPVKTWRRTA